MNINFSSILLNISVNIVVVSGIVYCSFYLKTTDTLAQKQLAIEVIVECVEWQTLFAEIIIKISFQEVSEQQLELFGMFLQYFM